MPAEAWKPAVTDRTHFDLKRLEETLLNLRRYQEGQFAFSVYLHAKSVKKSILICEQSSDRSSSICTDEVDPLPLGLDSVGYRNRYSAARDAYPANVCSCRERDLRQVSRGVCFRAEAKSTSTADIGRKAALRQKVNAVSE